ncbi:MAG: septum formation initiator family protein [Candidatus Magasanikbacteria bacterium]|nr:septum formation initiator family protein [Candidatus Magasanikbacteria bacterium]
MSQNSNGWSQFFYSKIFLFIILVGIFFVGFAFLRSYYQDYQVKQEIERLKSEADTLESKKIETLEILKYVQSSDFAEQKARMEFNMSKPGEQVAIVKSGGSGEIGNGQVDNIVVESSNVSNFIKWWNFFTAY